MDQQRPGAETPHNDAYTPGSQTGSQAGSQINLPAAGSSSMLQLRSSTQVTLVETATEAPSSYDTKAPKDSAAPSLDSQKEEQYHIPENLSRHTSPAITEVRRTSQDTEDGFTEWSFAEQLKARQAALIERGLPPVRNVSLSWQNLSVRGVGGVDDVQFAPDLGAIVAPWTVIKQKKKVEAYAQSVAEKASAQPGFEPMAWQKGMPTPKKGEPGLRKGQRFLLKDFNGLLKPGEMMLVVGRPGSGCTTFLKALSGLTSSYAGVDGTVRYGSLVAGSKDMIPLRGEVTFNDEEDVHDPNLLVGRTMDFATRMETPSDRVRALGKNGKPISEKQYQEETKTDLLRVFGIEHTAGTKVGNQYIRGVSGGERKRVSLAEFLTADSQIMCWDQATRGLDASTALGFARTCRTLCDVDKRVNVVTLYQAGNGIYDLFDKVSVIAESRLIYYGPRDMARNYFEQLGFEHMEGANTADYLTAVTALNERKIIPGYEGKVPNTAAEFAKIYQESDLCAQMRKEVDDWVADTAAREAESDELRRVNQTSKTKYAIKALPQKESWGKQVWGCIVREGQQRWGDQWSFWARQATTLVQGLINGSVYYNVPDNTSGLFLRGGVIFMLVLFPAILAFSDLSEAFMGRGVLGKQKSYAMYRSSLMFVAQVVLDIPIFIIQLAIYTLVTYWMAGLRSNAGNFFLMFFFTWLNSLVFTSLFRAIGYAFDIYNDASKIAGSVFTFFVLYGGFVIYTPSMHPWFSWIRWLNPVYYAIENLMATELTDLTLDCAPPQLAPYGPAYAGQPAGCAIAGGSPGTTLVSGTKYLDLALKFYKSHRWRNFGIMVALWIGAIFLGMLFVERLPAAGSKPAVTLYKRGGGSAFRAAAKDAEAAEGVDGEKLNNNGNQKIDGTATPRNNMRIGPPRSGAATPRSGTATPRSGMQIGPVTNEKNALSRTSSRLAEEAQGTTFTWKHLNYFVKAEGKDKQLLRDVSGYCQAGTITALMGSSGAGKTTLMDVLAARKSEGTIEGEVKLNGHSLPVSFQRTTGYCEQVDIHLPTSTVREALEFSALLRQPRHISEEDKLAYVDVIIDLLELHDIEDAIVGVPGAGLGVEQRKRLTIGVELVSRPTLLFLDEPTSGLDGQSSYQILQFLRKLAAQGQSILCTIHQPSAALFAEFDQLLLLKAGGRTVYFGPVSKVKSYFTGNGAPWPRDVNPAEQMIDVVSGDISKSKDWSEVWKASPECSQMMIDLDNVNEEAKSQYHETQEDSHKYAASTSTQLRLVIHRATVQLYRDTEYVMNKLMLHIMTGLIVGFTYWKMGTAYADLQNKVFALFQFVFVAPGVIVQTQPKFIANRDVFESREKKSMFYRWQVFCAGEILAEVPYLILCAFFYFVTFYWTAGFSSEAGVAGPVFLQMVFYEFLYTGMGQFIAAYAPNPVFAAMVLPLFISTLATFAGIMIPYQQLTAFWRYWLYWLDPFTYFMQGLITFPIWDTKVECRPHEYGYFDPPSGQTCGQYLQTFMSYASGYLNNPEATANCEYCGYKKGSEYLYNLNIKRHIIGWQGILITLLFIISSYSFVFLLLKLRSKGTKTASS